MNLGMACRSHSRVRPADPAPVFQVWAMALFVGLAVTVLPGSAGADETTPLGRGLYVRMYTGVGVTGPSDLRIRQPGQGTDFTFEQVSWAHQSLSTDWTRDSIPYVGVRVGLFPVGPRWLSVSAEVVHFKILAETERAVRVRGTSRGVPIDQIVPMQQFVEVYRVTNGVNLILGNLAAHNGIGRSRRFPEGRTELFGGAGAGVTIPFTRSVIGGVNRGQYEWGRPAAQLFGGVAWRMSPRWDLSIEYKLTGTTVDGSVVDGDSRSQLRTHHVAFGLGFRAGS